MCIRDRVEIFTERIADQVQAPMSALIRRGDHYFAFVKVGDEIESRQVEIGQNNDQYVVVKEGLSPGEAVLIDADSYASDGPLQGNP